MKKNVTVDDTLASQMLFQGKELSLPLSGDSILQQLYHTTNPLIEGFNLVSTTSPRVQSLDPFIPLNLPLNLS